MSIRRRLWLFMFLGFLLLSYSGVGFFQDYAEAKTKPTAPASTTAATLAGEPTSTGSVVVATALPCSGEFYSVRPGDTLWTIAGRAGVDLTALKLANPQVSPQALVVGSRICIP